MQRPFLITVLGQSEHNASFLSASTSRTIQLGTINTVPFYYGKLILRLHDATFGGVSSPASVSVNAYPSYPSPTDARVFSESTPLMTASLAQSATPPAVNADSASDLPPALRFELSLNQGGTNQATLWVVVSVELLVRPA